MHNMNRGVGVDDYSLKIPILADSILLFTKTDFFFFFLGSYTGTGGSSTNDFTSTLLLQGEKVPFELEMIDQMRKIIERKKKIIGKRTVDSDFDFSLESNTANYDISIYFLHPLIVSFLPSLS